MERKLAAAKAAVVVAVIPILLWALEIGPDPGYTGVPTEHGGATCTNAGCHDSGRTNDPNYKGSVAVTFAGGTSYVPGVKQRITVTISDPAPTQAAWGFQLTARSGSNNAMAGTFSPIDTNTLLMCSDLRFISVSAVCLPGVTTGCDTKTTNPVCPSSETLQYAEHSYNGYLSTMGLNSGTYQFDWTPPATSVGNITVFVAANAGVAGPPNRNGDHIYARTYTLTPSAGGPTPSVAGVSNAAGGQAGVFPNGYISIYGSNLASATDDWGKSIVGGQLPTKLDGVTVTVGGQPAYVSFVSAGQVNALVPNVGLGSMQVTVANGATASAPFTVTSQQVGPAFFPWPGNQPVATHADFTWAVKTGTFPGTTTIPAKPGEAIILWGTGFGPTSPAAPFGVAIPNSPTYFAATPATATIGGIKADVYATVLAPGFAGEYQVIVTVPPSLADGDYPVVATIAGAQSPTLTLTVHK